MRVLSNKSAPLYRLIGRPLALFTALLSLLAACSAAPTPVDAPASAAEPSGAAPVTANQASTSPEPEQYGTFTEEQLYQAIVSELSAQRGGLEQAGENYFDLAFETKDLSIIRRAVQFASANGDTNALLQLGLLWTEVSPDDPQPHFMLSIEFLEAGNYSQALSHMARVIDLGGEIDFSALAARTGDLQPPARARLIENLRALSREFTENYSLRFALVQLLAQNRQFEDALLELQLLIQLQGQDPMLTRLQSQILVSANDLTQARRVLRRGVRDWPEDRALRMSYARLLIQEQEFGAAREQFRSLVEREPEDWETWYSIALLDMEMENYAAAADSLERLLQVDQRADESRYYLGFVYAQMDELDTAIDYYRQVRIGTNNYLAAQQEATRLAVRLGRLADAHAWLQSQSRGQPRLEILFTTIESSVLIQAGHPEAAGELLATALNKYPNETDLLFARVLLSDSQGDQAASERDLRQIIRMQPEDSRALNHLGYMLADQTERHAEALELIERAIAVSPDDPAIIDSLGWAQYKLGRYPEALRNLRRAYALFPDHEVASHLGEVLWQMGREDEAVAVWEEALQERPDSELIADVMERFMPDR